MSEPQSPISVITVSEAVESLDSRLREAFDGEPVWIKGVLSGLSRDRSRSGVRYFQLVEFGHSPKNQRPVARVNAVLLHRERDHVNSKLSRAGVAGAIADDEEVVLQGSFGVYAPTGTMQFRVTDIDVTALRVRRIAEREVALQALRDKGVLDLNQSLPVASMPLRIGLVTSRTGAARRDVERVLNESPFAITVLFGDAQVQGDSAPQSIIAALHGVVAARPDLVVICRGGGDELDLRVFDDQALAEAVARAPVPVFVGIGHEIDNTVIDAVAHESFSTPSTAAQKAVALLRDCEAVIKMVAADLGKVVDKRTATLRHQHQQTASQLEFAAQLHSRTLRDKLHGSREALTVATNTRLTSYSSQLRGLRDVMVRESDNRIDDSRKAMGAAREMLGALDPAVRLRQGWSITRTIEGQPVTSHAAVAVGDVLTTRVADGIITSRVQHSTHQQAS